MIGRISGKLVEKAPPRVLVDVSGIGYEIDVPMSTFYNLPAPGSTVTLLTHFIVRDDAQLLYGFGTSEERFAFRELIRIGGIGPRIALAVLSGMPAAELADAVARQDAARLVKVPGIGRKTAERLLLELKGKLAPELQQAAAAGTAGADIVQALVALGYSERDAQAALQSLPAEIGVADGIKLALRALTR